MGTPRPRGLPTPRGGAQGACAVVRARGFGRRLPRRRAVPRDTAGATAASRPREGRGGVGLCSLSRSGAGEGW